ncbi:hypothetical protein D3C76_18910 [compost metagenome]
MEDKWESCPRCKSNEVVSRGKMFYFLSWLAIAAIMLWIGLLVFWPLFILGFVPIIISVFSFMKKPINRCRKCNHKWRP